MSNPCPERDKAAKELVRRLVTCGHRILVLCYGCDTGPYSQAPHPCEEKKGGSGVWALRPANASHSTIKKMVKAKEIDRLVLDLNRDLIVLQAGSFYDPPNVDYERIEKRMMKHYFWEEKKRLERIGEEVDKSGVPQITAQQRQATDERRCHKTATLRKLYDGGQMSPSARMPTQWWPPGPGEAKRNHASIMTSIMGAGTETGRLTSEKSNMCYDRKCDSCGRECAAVPADLAHFNCGPCRLEERKLTMRVVSQVKEAGAGVVKKITMHDIQKASAEVVKHPYALSPNGNIVACDPHVSDLLAPVPVTPSRKERICKERIYLDEPHKYKGKFLPPGDHRHQTFTVRPCENGTPGGRCLYSLSPAVNAQGCQCDKCASGRETIENVCSKRGYVYVDRKKYEAGKAACFNKALAPGMNRCRAGDVVQLRVPWSPGKRVGKIKEIQYTAPLQAVVEYETGGTETHQLHKLELVNACAEIKCAGPDHVCEFTHHRVSTGEVRVTCRRCDKEAACKVCGKLTSRDGTRSLFWEKGGIFCDRHQGESKPAGEMGETEPQECKLGTVEQLEHKPTIKLKSGHWTGPCPDCSEDLFYSVHEDEGKCSCGYVVPREPMPEEEMTARDAEETNRPALSSEKREELYDAGRGVKYEPGTTKIVVQFNLPQEPPCTCENVNLPHTPNCPWKKWKNSKNESKS